ncbi:tRNA pseudouridine(38-40) synthase TruA [Parasphaerochaeta coccoides]|uniref:tRNA pseudouridine synthase A n=1 Tax=Parasphaerochaeta coccoides (strain ATCC BAA-1237 / DSM 17374 / SPN1) TaxID=760011 RepID=F4GI58_PARC1|nr:tRNA pseudouridine(38-40) synthase TruA [Parasphaerochaeta coccoides]AEC02656.1 tRNA pseudouridine synthase A [Parasphaerochaeta coccoides DSM 17374]
MARSDWRRPASHPYEEGCVRRVRMTVAYDGTGYSGWQHQRNAPSVQAEIEDALYRLTGHSVTVVGSGRTDSGVHALGQVCHFDLPDERFPAVVFKRALNAFLPPAIRIMDSEETNDSFHARFSAMAREYRYLIKREADMTPFDSGRVWVVKELPSLELLKAHAAEIAGTHDFTTFTAAGDMCERRHRDIYVSDFSVEKDIHGAEVLVYTICGNAFLYKMVRSIVGTLFFLVLGGVPATETARRLAARDRSQAGRTASAHGLYLSRISFDEKEYEWFEHLHPSMEMPSEDREREDSDDEA